MATNACAGASNSAKQKAPRVPEPPASLAGFRRRDLKPKNGRNSRMMARESVGGTHEHGGGALAPPKLDERTERRLPQNAFSNAPGVRPRAQPHQVEYCRRTGYSSLRLEPGEGGRACAGGARRKHNPVKTAAVVAMEQTFETDLHQQANLMWRVVQ